MGIQNTRPAGRPEGLVAGRLVCFYLMKIYFPDFQPFKVCFTIDCFFSSLREHWAASTKCFWYNGMLSQANAAYCRKLLSFVLHFTDERACRIAMHWHPYWFFLTKVEAVSGAWTRFSRSLKIVHLKEWFFQFNLYLCQACGWIFWLLVSTLGLIVLRRGTFLSYLLLLSSFV